jgi:large-conductance mechanosensitive channel
MDDDGIFDLIIGFFQLIGGCVRWLFFLGKKKLKVLLEQEFINGVIGFLIIGFTVWMLLRPILRWILHIL